MVNLTSELIFDYDKLIQTIYIYFCFN